MATAYNYGKGPQVIGSVDHDQAQMMQQALISKLNYKVPPPPGTSTTQRTTVVLPSTTLLIDPEEGDKRRRQKQHMASESSTAPNFGDMHRRASAIDTQNQKISRTEYLNGNQNYPMHSNYDFMKPNGATMKKDRIRHTVTGPNVSPTSETVTIQPENKRKLWLVGGAIFLAWAVFH